MTFHQRQYGTEPQARQREPYVRFPAEFYYIDGENLRRMESMARDLRRQGLGQFAERLNLALVAFKYEE